MQSLAVFKNQLLKCKRVSKPLNLSSSVVWETRRERRYQRLFGIPDIWRPPSLVTPSANLEQKLNFQHMRHHKSARAEMGYKSTPTCEIIMRIGILGLTRLLITFLTTIVKFFNKVLCDSELEITVTAFTFFRLIPKWFLPSRAPSLQHVFTLPLYKKVTVQISIVSLFIFFLLLQIFSANMENPASWHCEPHVVQI